MKKTEQTSRGLVTAMFEELDALRSGESTPQMARAKASVANTICAVSRLEMDYARFVADSRSDSGRIANINLGITEQAAEEAA